MSDLSFTLVQSSLHWEDTWANLQMFGQKMEAINTPTHVVVLPEMFSTGFSMKPEALALESYAQSLSWMKEMARKKKLIITGSVMAAEEDRYHNRMVWMQPDGAFGYYDKRHLFAYAGEHEHFAPGNQRLIASVNGWKVHLLVCYDLRFPVWARQQYGEGGSFEYDVLVYVANWPERRNSAWKTLLQARAIENQCYVIGVNRVGTDGNDIFCLFEISCKIRNTLHTRILASL